MCWYQSKLNERDCWLGKSGVFMVNIWLFVFRGILSCVNDWILFFRVRWQLNAHKNIQYDNNVTLKLNKTSRDSSSDVYVVSVVGSVILLSNTKSYPFSFENELRYSSIFGPEIKTPNTKNSLVDLACRILECNCLFKRSPKRALSSSCSFLLASFTFISPQPTSWWLVCIKKSWVSSLPLVSLFVMEGFSLYK